jgi:hypothetical protein
MATRSVSSYPTDAEVVRMQASRSQLSLFQRMKCGRKWLLALVALLVLSQMLVAMPNPPSRPFLFVHGWCGSANDWAPLIESLNGTLPSAMFSSDNQINKTVYIVEYTLIPPFYSFRGLRGKTRRTEF